MSSSVCIWGGTVDGVNYLLQIRIGDGEQFYTGNIPGNEALDGIGDKAAIREAGNAAEETISYVKDGKAYTIALSAHEIGKTQLAKAKRDQLISLRQERCERLKRPALASAFMTLDIRIDRELCMGSGNCGFWAPGVFDLDDDGIAIVLDPDAQPEEKIVLAAQGCPTQAIAVFRGEEKLV